MITSILINQILQAPFCRKEHTITVPSKTATSTKRIFRACLLYTSFGNSDYIHKQGVTDDDLYDLASVTKVAATTLAVMKLYDQGLVNLDEPLSKTLKYLENSNKKKITIREVRTHQAGLVAWIPFYPVSYTHLDVYKRQLAAMRNEQLISDFGLAVSRHLRRMGVHISFSPVSDINSNPANRCV